MRVVFSPVTLGKRVKQFDAGAFALTEAVYHPAFELPRHAHAAATISFVIKGSCTEIVGKSAFECSPYGPILKPPGEEHSNQYGRTGAKCLLIEIRPDGLEMIRTFSPILDHVFHAHEGSYYGLAMRIHKEFLTMDSAAALSIEGLVLELMGMATRRSAEGLSPKPPRWLREAREFINENFRERISLLSLAALVDVQPAYLARVFRKHYQCTLGHYVRRLRLNHASKELGHSSVSLADIATATGFYDQSHFTHAFKLHTGVTPAEFRHACQEGQSATKRSGSS